MIKEPMFGNNIYDIKNHTYNKSSNSHTFENIVPSSYCISSSPTNVKFWISARFNQINIIYPNKSGRNRYMSNVDKGCCWLQRPVYTTWPFQDNGLTLQQYKQARRARRESCMLILLKIDASVLKQPSALLFWRNSKKMKNGFDDKGRL
jgi:hypothetical protein